MQQRPQQRHADNVGYALAVIGRSAAMPPNKGAPKDSQVTYCYAFGGYPGMIATTRCSGAQVTCLANSCAQAGIR